MGVQRLNDIPGFNIDRVAAAAGDDPDVLRLENLDTDIPPPAEAIDTTRAASRYLSYVLAGRQAHRFRVAQEERLDRKSTRLNSSHLGISYAVFCLKKKK